MYIYQLNPDEEAGGSTDKEQSKDEDKYESCQFWVNIT